MQVKRYWMLAVLLVTALIFAACAAPAPVQPAAGPAEEATAVPAEGAAAAIDWEAVDPSGQTVLFWHQHTGGRAETLAAMVEEFNKTNEYGITVDQQNQGDYPDIFNKMVNVINTSEAPALVVAYQNQAATYQLADGLVDMNGLMNSAKWGLSAEDQADFFPGFFSSDVFPNFGGQRLGLAPNRSMEVMYYNMDWLKELGFEAAPATPDEFKAAACAAAKTPFTKSKGATSMGYQLSVDASRLASWTYAFGGDIFDSATGKFTYNSDAAKAAMTFLQDLFKEGCATVVAERFGDQTDFGNGALLFTVGSSSGLPFYRDAVTAGAAFDWSVAALPHTSADPLMNVYGASVSIPKTTPEQELAAWIFVKYYTSKEIQAKWAEASNYFPVRKSVADNMTDYFAANPAYKTAFDLLPYTTAEPPVPGYDFVRTEAQKVMAAIVDGAEVASSLDALNEFANKTLDEQMAQMK